MEHLIIPELNNSKIRRTIDGKISVYDLIKVAGQKKGHYEVWSRLKESHPEVVTKCEDFHFKGRGQRKTPVTDLKGALYIFGLLPGELGTRYREETVDLVIKYIKGDADLGLKLLYRDKNKERVERAKRRMQVSDTNKQVVSFVSQNPGSTYSDVHNDRYKGLYRKNAKQLRLECGAKGKETPLNYMSEMDLTLNLLVNQVAIRAGNPNVVFEAASNVREGVEKTLKESLVPQWVGSCLPPSKARRQLNGQLEIPLFEA